MLKHDRSLFSFLLYEILKWVVKNWFGGCSVSVGNQHPVVPQLSHIQNTLSILKLLSTWQLLKFQPSYQFSTQEERTGKDKMIYFSYNPPSIWFFLSAQQLHLQGKLKHIIFLNVEYITTLNNTGPVTKKRKWIVGASAIL